MTVFDFFFLNYLFSSSGNVVLAVHLTHRWNFDVLSAYRSPDQPCPRPNEPDPPVQFRSSHWLLMRHPAVRQYSPGPTSGSSHPSPKSIGSSMLPLTAVPQFGLYYLRPQRTELPKSCFW